VDANEFVNAVLPSKELTNEPDRYIEIDGKCCAARFNFADSVWSALHKSFAETFTVYEDAPMLKLLDLGTPGNSPGDVYHFFAPLHSTPGGPVTGEVFGSKTLIKMATDANPQLGDARNCSVLHLCQSSGSNCGFGRSGLSADRW
jgi:hypothetical protein